VRTLLLIDALPFLALAAPKPAIIQTEDLPDDGEDSPRRHRGHELERIREAEKALALGQVLRAARKAIGGVSPRSWTTWTHATPSVSSIVHVVHFPGLPGFPSPEQGCSGYEGGRLGSGRSRRLAAQADRATEVASRDPGASAPSYARSVAPLAAAPLPGG